MQTPNYLGIKFGLKVNLILLALTVCWTGETKAQSKEEDIISFSGLLDEMVDRDIIARYPKQNFKQKQQSSYNRASKTPDDEEGWYNNIDRFEYIRIDTINGKPEWVMMDHTGPGAMTRVWMPDRLSPQAKLAGKVHDGDGIMRVYLDDKPKPVLEGPPHDLFNGTIYAGFPFGHKSLSSAVSFLPIPWGKRCKITLDQEPFFYIFTYRAYDQGTKVKTFQLDDLVAAKSKMEKTGKVLMNPKNEKATESLKKVVKAGGEVAMDLKPGNNAIQTISVKLADYSITESTRSTILKIEFDDKETVWTPIGDFFGTGVGLHPFEGWYRTVSPDGEMMCRWVMPYQKKAKVSILNLGDSSIDVELAVSTKSWAWDDRSMYFHANWKMEKDVNTRPYSDWNYITIQGKGVYVGDALTIWNPVKRWWGEGDAKIWVDGEGFPSMFGTGTEDYYAYSWGGRNRGFYEHPFHAQVRVAEFDKHYSQEVPVEGDTQGYSTETRTRSLDGITFENSLKLDMEVWSWTDCQMDYSVGTYWYALPGATSSTKPMPKEAVLPARNLEK